MGQHPVGDLLRSHKIHRPIFVIVLHRTMAQVYLVMPPVIRRVPSPPAFDVNCALGDAFAVLVRRLVIVTLHAMLMGTGWGKLAKNRNCLIYLV